MKRKYVFFAVALFVAAELPGMTKAEETALWISAGVGAVIGAGLDMIYVAQTFPMLQPVPETWVVPTVTAAAIVVQTGTSIGLAVLFTEVYTSIRPNIWWSVPTGALLGAIAQGLSFGLAAGTVQAIAIPTGALKIEDPSFRGDLQWWQYFGEGLVMGFLTGGILGFLEGAIAGPILTLTMVY